MIFLIRVIVLCLSITLNNLPTSAQESLTETNNKPIIGDKIERNAIEGISYESKGENIIWDFSNCNIKETQSFIKFSTDTLGYKSIEPGIRKHYIQKDNNIWMYAYQSMLITLKYTKPLLTLLFPFHYGDSISSSFYGHGLYCNTYKLTNNGTRTIIADAYGKIILPNKSLLPDILRIHITTTKDVLLEGLQTNHADSAIAKQEISENYLWFAEGSRYPIFEYCTNTSYDKGKPIASQTKAYCYLPDEILRKTIPYEIWSIDKNSYLQKSLSNNTDKLNDYLSFNITINNKVINISYRTFLDTDINFIITNSKGMVYQSKKIKCHKGEINNIGFNCSGYQPGEYVIYINVNGKTNSKKIHIK